MKRIVLVRPAVEAGERLGFLPGDMAQKVDPYLRPLYDALYDLMGYDKVAKMFERGAIEIAPLAFMRGRTLNHSFVILDEAQNTTPEQMKMFLTRIGFGSKAVVTGDVTQIDLARGQKSGLVDAQEVLKNVRGIAFTYFGTEDVVRHPLVQRIVNAYENREARDARARAASRERERPRAAAPRPDRAVRDARARRARRATISATGSRAALRARCADHGAPRRARGRPRAQPRLPRQGLRDQRADLRAATTRRPTTAISRCARRWSRAKRARRARTSTAHYAHLTVHGVLHLQGYDHEREPRRGEHGKARDAHTEAAGLSRSLRTALPIMDDTHSKPIAARAHLGVHHARARGPRAADRAAALGVRAQPARRRRARR